jgi:signal transduction protein with GAF and PtsI domain
LTHADIEVLPPHTGVGGFFLYGGPEMSSENKRPVNGDETVDLFWKISESLVSKNYLQEILDLIVTVTAEVMQTKVCSLMLLDETAGELKIAATQALSAAYTSKGNVKVGESVSGNVVQSGKPMIVPDVTKHPSYGYPDVAKKEGLVSMLSVPMRIKDRMIGVINCYTKQPHAFTDLETRTLQVVANQAAVAIEHTRLQEENFAVKKALEDRKIIEQAKALIMEHEGLKEPDAYKVLQKTSRDNRTSMAEFARSVIMVYGMKKGKV